MRWIAALVLAVSSLSLAPTASGAPSTLLAWQAQQPAASAEAEAPADHHVATQAAAAVEEAVGALARWRRAVVAWAPRGFAGLIVLAVLWLAASIVSRVVRAVGCRAKLDSVLTNLFARTAKAALLTLGLISGLGTMGVNVSALVAGLGLTGFALGFALRDTLSNLVAGALLLVYRPFGVGDRISVAGVEGRVVAIDLRYTTIEGEDKRMLAPNATLFNNTVTVFADKTQTPPAAP